MANRFDHDDHWGRPFAPSPRPLPGPHRSAVYSKAGAVHPKASASATASAARLFLSVREARRFIRRAIKEAFKRGETPTYINVYRCRRRSRVRVHCRFFERGTFADNTGQQLGYKCTGKGRVRETSRLYSVRLDGACEAYELGS